MQVHIQQAANFRHTAVQSIYSCRSSYFELVMQEYSSEGSVCEFQLVVGVAYGFKNCVLNSLSESDSHVRCSDLLS